MNTIYKTKQIQKIGYRFTSFFLLINLLIVPQISWSNHSIYQGGKELSWNFGFQADKLFNTGENFNLLKIGKDGFQENNIILNRKIDGGFNNNILAVTKSIRLLNNGPVGSAPIASVSDVIVCNGATTVDIPVMVTDLNNVGSFSLTFGFLPSSLSAPIILSRNAVFDESGHVWSAFEFTTDPVILASGVFKMTGRGANYDDGITLPSNTILFILRFNININFSTAILSFNDDIQGTACEFTGVAPLFTPMTELPNNGSYINGGVKIVNDPSINITASASEICIGDSTLLIADTAGGTGSNMIQWQIKNAGNWNDILGANDYSYVVSPASIKDFHAIYTCSGNACNTAISNTQTITVYPASVGGLLIGKGNAIYGSSIPDLILNSYTGTIQRWEKKLNSGNWMPISNISATYSEIPATAGIWYYRAVVKSGVCTESYSDVIIDTVFKKTLIIKAENKAKIYNGLVFGAFTVSYNGLLSGESASDLSGSLTFSGSAVSATNVGTYVIIPGGLIADNYEISFQNGELHINNAASNIVFIDMNDGFGSLRNAIENAIDSGVILFDPVIDNTIITLSTATLIIDRNIIFDNSNLTYGITILGNITILPGFTLTIRNASKFTVIGTIINNGGKGNAGLVISSGASFIHNTQNLAATVERYLSNSWHLFGSPFKKNMGAVLADITPVGGSIQMKPFTNGSAWLANVSSPNYNLLPVVGYAVKPSIAFISSLKGNLYYSPVVFDYTTALVYNGTAANQSWNLMANPYTSFLNWNLMGKTNVSTTLYLWDNSLYPNFSPLANSSYLRTFNSCNNVGVPANTTPYIAPLQGFFVKAVYTNPKISFPPSARTHISSVYYKTATSTEILLRLKVETESGNDELVICRNPEANHCFEQFDSEKMFNELPVEIYSQSSTGENLIINSINTTNTIIPIGIKGSVGTKAKITAFALETSEQIYLEDRFKGKLIRLSENTNCNFEFDSDIVSGRFFIRFSNISTPLTVSEIMIFEDNNQLSIIAQTGEELQLIEVFSMTGTSVFKSEVDNLNVFTSKLNLSSGIYIVSVKTSLGTKNVKMRWS